MMKRQTMSSRWSVLEKSALVVACGIGSGALAATLDISSVPLYLDTAVTPNVLFIVDDSKSMRFRSMPGASWVGNIGNATDEVGSWNYSPDISSVNTNNLYRFCSGTNVIMYDPSKVYEPWVGVDINGDPYPDQLITAAARYPFDNAADSDDDFKDLATSVDLTKKDDDGNEMGFFPFYDGDGDGVIDQYVDSDGDNSLDRYIKLDDNDAFSGWVDLNGNMVYDPGEFESELECPRNSMSDAQLDKWFVSVSEFSDTTQDEIGFGDNPMTKAELETNYANWYTYYRTREHAAIAGLAPVVLESNLRMGLRYILDPDDLATDITDMTDSANKAALMQNIFAQSSRDFGTPLRRALHEAGQYFSDTNGPIFGEDAGGTCQQNFAILITDGQQRDSDESRTISYLVDLPGDNDDVDSNGIGNYGSALDDSFADRESGSDDDGLRSNTLADIALYYYQNDLRSDLDDDVEPSPTNVFDTAEHQHMKTYTVGFGVSGTLPLDVEPTDSAFAGWPTVQSTFQGATTESIDDVWHAAYNGRGEFLTADDPDALTEALNEALESIVGESSSSAAVAVSSGSLQTDSSLFQATYDSDVWGGSIYSIPIESDGSVDTDNQELASVIPSASTRTIVTHNGFTDSTADGIAFQWASLSTAQQAELNDDETLLNYLRGSSAYEGEGDGDFRERDELIVTGSSGPLADIVNSAPVYVANPNFIYPDTLEDTAYSEFKSNPDGTTSNDVELDTRTNVRKPMMYVGSNGGFLHAFDVSLESVTDAATGEVTTQSSSTFGDELFAYVPSMLMDKLPELAEQDYDHEFYVDATPTVGDAYVEISGSREWRTILVGGLNAGGQGIYALDITDPDSFDSETSAAKNVLWEFSDSHSANMGYSFSKPIIAKSNRSGNDTWVAIFGNGYNNTEADGIEGSGTSVLYVVDLATGELLSEINTGKNDDSTAPNGLSSPTALDVDGNNTVDYVYAGDLEGNLWKFDLTSSTYGDWDVAYESSGDKVPLYTACTGDTCDLDDTTETDSRQPITIKPTVGVNVGATGYLIYFGTGTYFLSTDNSNDDLQSVYAIWDRQDASLMSFDRSDLLQQSILEELSVTSTNDDGSTVTTEQRLTSSNYITWHTDTSILPSDDTTTETHLGWYIDLVNTEDGNTDEYGERQISEMSLRDGNLIFTTSIPATVPCSVGGDGWIMALDATNGSGPDDVVIDVNLDSNFDESDYVEFDALSGDSTPSSGTKTDTLASSCVFITLADGTQVCLSSQADATVDSFSISSGAALGRWMWRELTD